jgi:uroporphyrinogen-III decarboxylase
VEETNGRRVIRETTPDGTLTTAEAFAPSSHSWHPIEFPIKSRADLRAARHLLVGNRFEAPAEAVERAAERLRQVGDRGIVMTDMGISPLMHLIQHLIGPDATWYFLADFPDEMNELIGLMHEERLRFLRALLPACPYDYICSVENTSTTLLSPAIFERYCWRHLADYGRLIRERGKHHVLHMCGHLKALLPRMGELPAIAIEAYTRPPVGNTTLADRARLCPKTAVIGGTSAVLWLQPVEAICETIERDLAEAGTMRGVVLTSAGVMPPACPIEKIRQVGAFVRKVTSAA